jgi:hypothetical protein
MGLIGGDKDGYAFQDFSVYPTFSQMAGEFQIGDSCLPSRFFDTPFG